MRQLLRGKKKRATIRRNAGRDSDRFPGAFYRFIIASRDSRALGWACIQLPLPAYSSLVNPCPIVCYPFNARSAANYSRHYALRAPRLSR